VNIKKKYFMILRLRYNKRFVMNKGFKKIFLRYKYL